MFAVFYLYLTVQCANWISDFTSPDLPMLKQVFRISTVVSTELTSLFSCVTYLTPILGAYVADRYLGRSVPFICIFSQAFTCVLIYVCLIWIWSLHCREWNKGVNLYCLCSFKTILVFCAIYVAGMIACTVAAHPNWVGWTQPIFFIGNEWFTCCTALLGRVNNTTLMLHSIALSSCKGSTRFASSYFVAPWIHRFDTARGRACWWMHAPVHRTGLYVGVTTGSGGIKPNVVVLGADQVDYYIYIYIWCNTYVHLNPYREVNDLTYPGQALGATYFALWHCSQRTSTPYSTQLQPFTCVVCRNTTCNPSTLAHCVESEPLMCLCCYQ